MTDHIVKYGHGEEFTWDVNPPLCYELVWMLTMLTPVPDSGDTRKDKQAAMPPPNECVETVKKMIPEVMREKNALVGRLNATHQRIAEEEDPVTKVRRKVEWVADRDRSVEALTTIVASLQRALEEEDRSNHGSTASLCSSI